MQTSKRSSSSGYSPSIQMTLEIDGRTLAIAEVGPNYLVVEKPCTLGPARGTLIITVDGEDVKRLVSLPAGLNSHLDRQPISVLRSLTPALAG